MAGEHDKWSQWLLETRFGGDAEARDRMLAMLTGVRDRVLEHAALQEGETLLDVGAGDGLVGLAAAERVGPSGHIILTEVSERLLQQGRARAEEAGVAGRCRFLLAPAEKLTGVADSSVNAVTTRSVLIYVDDKRAALAEFFRVLKPGGRISLYEPINEFEVSNRPPGSFRGYRLARNAALADRLAAYCHGPTSTMVEFTERDFVGACRDAGFGEVHAEVRLDVGRQTPRDWDLFLNAPPNPLVPPLREALEELLTADERGRLVSELVPKVESGDGIYRGGSMFLWAEKTS